MKFMICIISIIMSSILTYGSWFFVPGLSDNQIIAIASTSSTISGILFGFVLASVTLLLSAKDNSLVKNTQKTGYFQILVKKLQLTMLFLIVTCIIFLMSLFIPTTSIITLINIKYVSIIIILGVFFMWMSLSYFLIVWREYTKFTSNM